MDKFAPASGDRPNSDTPNNRFAAQAATAEDILKEQTVGLVNLSEFRKRRAEALERKEREGSTGGSGATTPRDGASTPQPLFKKKRKVAPKGKISFGLDDEDDTESAASTNATPRGTTPTDSSAVISENETKSVKKRLGANISIGVKPRVMTKSALAREAEQADIARKDFVKMREAVKATEIIIPFVFYDGTNIPGGRCRMKKGDQIWLFLDKARKVGAELGVGGDKSRRDWARVSVDDLMLVRGEVILPHHYDFYYFLFNKVVAFDNHIFNYSSEPTKGTPQMMETDVEVLEPLDYNPLLPTGKAKDKKSTIPDVELEGYDDDATLTKVVDRRWYERNKHIFPASVWTEYGPEKDLSKTQRKDAEGNSFFLS
ncbi:XAP5, circadian clock regulator-domain-containing protein [Dendryphion nanum]|uniref:XAP5, circadian clock regulator-domain-containing protein n=1 Tax=Dendryphion nanum TaxID=256645 RepID=A0A9P9D7X8_9PLEO|nr:XAP5, circadian clock regulator-domain-containing protein [Dendryphion nanum]